MVKRTLLLIALFNIILNVYSQKCKSEIDPFTNEKIDSYNYGNKTVYFELKKNEISFEIMFYYLGERHYEFKEGTEMLLKLENNKKLSLKTVRISKPRFEQVSSASRIPSLFGNTMTTFSSDTFTGYSFEFKLSKESLEELANSRIKLIRLPDTQDGKYYDVEGKGRTKPKVKAVNKGAKCIKKLM